MRKKCNMVWPAVVATAIFAVAPLAQGAIVHDVTGWAVHNGASTVSNGGTNSPTFGTADNITVMGSFGDIELSKDGDYVTLTTTLEVATRTGNTGTNNLNTQLRIGLFSGPDGAVVAEDFPNYGIIFEYTNDAPAATNRRLIREQTSDTQTAPFVSPVNIGNGASDTGNDSIQGANIDPVEFVMTLTRNGSALDITGKIEGTDSVSGNPFLSNFSLLGYTPAAVGFSFNRVGFFFGGNVDGANGATLRDTIVTTNVPEPSAWVLATTMVLGSLLIRQRRDRRT